MTETNYKLIYNLAINPKARVDVLAKGIKVSTKTIKRRLDRLDVN